MLVTVGLAYLAIHEIITHTMTKFFNDETKVITHIIANEKTALNNSPTVKQEILDTPDENKLPFFRYYIRILDSHHNPVIETQGAEHIVALLKKSTEIKDYNVHVCKQYNLTTKYRVKQFDVFNANGTHYIAQIILNITFQEKIFYTYLTISLAFLAIGILLSIVLGYFITKHSLKSIYQLADIFHKSDSKTLSKRIETQNWPQETAYLGDCYNTMIDRIEKSFVQLKQFSSDVAHELRTPLSRLIYATELDHNDQSNLEDLYNIKKILDSLLFLARFDEHKMDIQKSKLNIRDEIEDIIDFYLPLAEEQQIDINVSGKAEFDFEPTMFKRIVSNLISNTIKYAGAQSTLTIHIEQNSSGLTLTFSDNGAGIETADLDKIFDRFYRADQVRTSTSQQGFGLGLAITKSIVELHNGNIDVRSTVGKGTLFKLFFPA